MQNTITDTGQLLPINKKSFVVVCYITLLATSLIYLNRQSSSKNTTQEYSELIRISACVQTDVSGKGIFGLADYHWANKLTVLTEGRIVLSPVNGKTLRFMPWLGTRHWTNHNFHFIVSQKNVDQSVYDDKKLVYPLSTEKAISLAGNPDHTSDCGKLVVLYYSDPIKIL